MKLSKLDHSDSVYLEVKEDLCSAATHRQLLPFLGAGVSFDPPSCLPLAETLVEPLVRAIWGAGQYALSESKIERRDFALARSRVEEARLERLLDVLHRTHGRPALEYLNVLWSTDWNENHASIGCLAASGLLERCVTLNFDLLIEEAVKYYDFSSSIVCPLTSANLKHGSGSERLLIVKPHGSFATDKSKSERFENLSATLSQVGSYPDDRNVAAIESSLTKCPTLVIAGYSDMDWDIFPILRKLSHLIENIVWVKYVPDSRLSCSIDTLYLEIPELVRKWLEGLGERSSVVFGTSRFLFTDIVNELGFRIKRRDTIGPTRRIPNACAFEGSLDQDDPITVKTIVSLAMLVENTGSFCEMLHEWLIQNQIIRKTQELGHYVEDLAAHQSHSTGHYKRAVVYEKRAVKLAQTLAGASSNLVPKYLVWLGYEHLCMAKGPAPPLVLWPTTTVVNIIRGNRLMNAGTKLASDEIKGTLVALAAYYRVDLIHSWASFFLLLGRRFNAVTRFLFKLVSRKYERISSLSPLLGEGYYWLRRLEADLLSGCKLEKRRAVEDRLDELEFRHNVLQNHLQIGNIHVYRGLIAFSQDGDRTTALNELSAAKEVWDQVGTEMRSPQRRLLVFGRYFGATDITFWHALKGLFRK